MSRLTLESMMAPGGLMDGASNLTASLLEAPLRARAIELEERARRDNLARQDTRLSLQQQAFDERTDRAAKDLKIDALTRMLEALAAGGGGGGSGGSRGGGSGGTDPTGGVGLKTVTDDAGAFRVDPVLTDLRGQAAELEALVESQMNPLDANRIRAEELGPLRAQILQRQQEILAGRMGEAARQALLQEQAAAQGDLSGLLRSFDEQVAGIAGVDPLMQSLETSAASPAAPTPDTGAPAPAAPAPGPLVGLGQPFQEEAQAPLTVESIIQGNRDRGRPENQPRQPVTMEGALQDVQREINENPQRTVEEIEALLSPEELTTVAVEDRKQQQEDLQLQMRELEKEIQAAREQANKPTGSPGVGGMLTLRDLAFQDIRQKQQALDTLQAQEQRLRLEIADIMGMDLTSPSPVEPVPMSLLQAEGRTEGDSMSLPAPSGPQLSLSALR